MRLAALVLLAALAGVPACAAPSPLRFERRLAAEWEPAVGVLIGWPLHLPEDLVIALAEEVPLHVVVAGEDAEREAREQLAEWGLPPERLRFLRARQSSGHYGTRDWGPFALFDEEGNLSLLDARYVDYPLSRAGVDEPLAWLRQVMPGFTLESENAAPAALAEQLGLPRVETRLAFTGGNVELDGMGTAFSTEVLARENEALGVPRAEALAEAKRLLGIERWIFLPDFEADWGAQHIDCVARLLDEERFLVKRVSPESPDHGAIERLVAAIGRLETPWGRPYEVLRIDAGRYEGAGLLDGGLRDASYVNALVLNGSVFVPLFGIESDEPALAAWRAAMPGYRVRGFRYADPERRWTYTDALHCRTKALFDPRMLALRHRRVRGPVEARTAPEIVVDAVGGSGDGLAGDSVRVHWRLRGEEPWRASALAPDASRAGRFVGSIPAAPPGTTVEYWVSAESRLGRRATKPPVAPAGFFAFAVSDR